MNFGTLTYIFTIASIFFLSCSYDQDITTEKNTQVLPEKAILTPEEYIDWSSQPNNLLIKEKTISEFNYKIKYLPTEQLVISELKKSNKSITTENINTLKKEYEGMEYFEMRVQVENYNDELAKYRVTDMSEYQTRIAYMAFAMQNNIKLSTEINNEIPCKLFHFERTYGITPYTTFLFAFSKQDIGNASERTVIYDDELFNKGRLKFNWSFKNIELPKIAIL